MLLSEITILFHGFRRFSFFFFFLFLERYFWVSLALTISVMSVYSTVKTKLQLLVLMLRNIGSQNINCTGNTSKEYCIIACACRGIIDLYFCKIWVIVYLCENITADQ